MCVEKTRAYVKDNKLKLMNAVVGWGRPVYAGEENVPLLSKVGSTDAPAVAAKPAAKPVAKKPAAPKAFAPLKVGSKGQPVKTIQAALKLKADGDFGPATEKAVKAWQKANKLPETGIVDEKTFKALKG
jgi:peptidoglycan hydrolase-like protein with peptidoglycan-binding domain